MASLTPTGIELLWAFRKSAKIKLCLAGEWRIYLSVLNYKRTSLKGPEFVQKTHFIKILTGAVNSHCSSSHKIWILWSVEKITTRKKDGFDRMRKITKDFHFHSEWRPQTQYRIRQNDAGYFLQPWMSTWYTLISSLVQEEPEKGHRFCGESPIKQ